ncbi:MAG TPA: thiamine pyrophosphate-dependent enzyme, partial [Puia sp.]
FQMLGMNGMITIAKYWKDWSDPRLIVIVLNNRDLNMVTWEQRAMLGDPRYDASQGVPDIPYAEYAKLLGLEGIKVDDPEKVPEALDWAFNARKPVLVEAYVDPSVPMLPPHINFKEMKAYTSAIVKGDSKAWDVIKQTYKDVVDEYFPAK